MKVSKTMTWEEMQDTKYVDDAFAFQDLTILDIMSAFNLVDEWCQNPEILRIEVDGDIITVTIE